MVRKVPEKKKRYNNWTMPSTGK